MTRPITALIAGALGAVLGAGCDQRVIGSGVYTCTDDTDCTWGWRCLPTAQGTKVCVDPRAGGDAGQPAESGPPDDDARGADRDQGQPSCGNGRLEGEEACDVAQLNSTLPDAPCRPDCTRPRCGDRIKDSGESCDGTAGCDAACRLTAPSRLAAWPAALCFGAAGPGCEPPRTRALTLYNGGATAVALAPGGLELHGCGDELSLGAPLGGAIAAGASAAVTVTFTARTAGFKSCALLVHAADGELVVPISAAVGPAQAQTDRFVQRADRRVDILFAIDASGSMADERARLMETAAAFAQIAAKTGIDFHLGAISIVEPATPDGLFGALYGDPRYMTSQSTSLEAEFKTRIDLPSGGGVERGIDAILAALSPALTSTADPSGCAACSAPQICVAGGCRRQNFGFRRPGASLEVLAMSDEDDLSNASPAELLARLGEDVDPLLGHLARVHGLLPESPASCAPASFYAATPRWDALIAQTGGERHDLCAQSYGPAIQAIAGRLFGLRRQLPLSRSPVASTIEVTVDGTPVSGARFDAPSRSVVLPTAPAAGAQIAVEYAVDCATAP